MSFCKSCLRECGADRSNVKGFCGIGREAQVARAFTHRWEEPLISGSRGSGAIFFCGCHLRCIYCQNRAIMRAESGKLYNAEDLCRLFLETEASGVHNLNLVTASHCANVVARALSLARERGLSVPVIFNCGGYEKEETLALLSPFIDVWLPDFKYADSLLAGLLSGAEDYTERAVSAIKAMRRFCPENIYAQEKEYTGQPHAGKSQTVETSDGLNGIKCTVEGQAETFRSNTVFVDRGRGAKNHGYPSLGQCGNHYSCNGGVTIIKRGVMIRHLVLPTCGENTRRVLDICAREFPGIPLSLMSQYYPVREFEGKLSFLNRTLTEGEYARAVRHMRLLEIPGFIQELSSATEAYTPDFKYTNPHN